MYVEKHEDDEQVEHSRNLLTESAHAARNAGSNLRTPALVAGAPAPQYLRAVISPQRPQPQQQGQQQYLRQYPRQQQARTPAQQQTQYPQQQYPQQHGQQQNVNPVPVNAPVWASQERTPAQQQTRTAYATGQHGQRQRPPAGAAGPPAPPPPATREPQHQQPNYSAITA